VNLNQEGCKRSMQKQHETWNNFQCFIDGGGNPRERARWPGAGRTYRMHADFQRVFRQTEEVKKSIVVTVACVLILLIIEIQCKIQEALLEYHDF
jgi:hypothetical protein